MCISCTSRKAYLVRIERTYWTNSCILSHESMAEISRPDQRDGLSASQVGFLREGESANGSSRKGPLASQNSGMGGVEKMISEEIISEFINSRIVDILLR